VHSVTVLVVEDFEDFRRFVCSALQQRAEFRVLVASDGLEAVQKAEAFQPDLILLDIGLPGLNGLEVARRVRSLIPTAKILFVSQESSSDIVREALTLGAGYVHKLRSQSDLLPAIEAVLGNQRFISSDLAPSNSTEAAHHHEILFCSDDAYLVDGLARFIASALKAGNAAIVVIAESHREDLFQRLQVLGVDSADATRRGTFISLDAAVGADPVQLPDIVKSLSEAAAKAGKKHPRIAFCGERAGRLWADGKTDEAIELERFCDELAKTHEVDILCVYPLPEDHEKHLGFKSICAEHSAVRSR
jgi:CheY-like chemotaxis protein